MSTVLFKAYPLNEDFTKVATKDVLTLFNLIAALL